MVGFPPLIGCFIINHPFWGTTIFGNTHLCNEILPNLYGGFLTKDYKDPFFSKARHVFFFWPWLGWGLVKILSKGFCGSPWRCKIFLFINVPEFCWAWWGSSYAKAMSFWFWILRSYGTAGIKQFLEDGAPKCKWLGSPPFISHGVRPFGRGPTTRPLGDNNDQHGY